MTANLIGVLPDDPATDREHIAAIMRRKLRARGGKVPAMQTQPSLWTRVAEGKRRDMTPAERAHLGAAHVAIKARSLRARGGVASDALAASEPSAYRFGILAAGVRVK